ncbi:hypothetical protein A3E15_02595 [Candidatus Woesebacteria bacterium RIFCSPHIGHO2_12_FULL_42_9]|uniref:Uncharacterized protein n=1 Tax=Candidatus Woesebacteria bacterium RIFCSPHIGHO2_12_FULL_42_9 TaxID=1802511 RepID=A0A1F8AWH4_9BACT|nr:MAG: hypothetical protein A3E15_02595 [Candidatus Woesebacteria bacterium RIFCSPHIGHO2_12_FULL_42_9]
MQQLVEVPIGSTFNSPIGQTVGLGNLVSIILSNALLLAGVLMVFFLVVGGIGVISGAGEDNPEKAGKGRQAVTFALMGFLVIFAAYWIIQVIEQVTGVEIFNPGF